MARKKKNITIKDPESQAFFGVVCLVISGLFFLSIFAESDLSQLVKKYIGIGTVVMSAAFFVAALRLFGTKTKYSSFSVVIFLILFLLAFIGWIHIFTANSESEAIAQQGRYGGLIGYQISSVAIDFFALEGAILVLGILMIAFFLTALRITPKQVSEYIVNVFTGLRFVAEKIGLGLKKMLELFSKGKEKVENVETNLALHKGDPEVKKKEEKKGLMKNIKEKISTEEGGLLNIKMVSDISGGRGKEEEKKEEGEAPEVNIKLQKQPQMQQVDNSVTESNTPTNSEFEDLSENTGEEVDLYAPKYPDWKLPPMDLLDPIKPSKKDSKDIIKQNAQAILETLNSFNISAQIKGYVQGPTITQYYIDPAAGVKFQRIANLAQDLGLTLATKSPLRIEQVPGTSFIGIDVPNANPEITQMRKTIKPIYSSPGDYKLGVAIGIDIGGKPVVTDLAKMPHLLIAGATGQGKSVLINALIVSLLLLKSPDELKFIMIDPKMVELAPYDGIPHLITSPVTDVSKSATALKWAVNEMESRYEMLKEARVRNIAQYTEQTGKNMPYIVIIIDEYADLMMQMKAEVEASIVRIAQKARAVGIHLIISTQRPTANIITGMIKANVPGRIALKVSSQLDSRLILDVGGAETLIGRGDLLIKSESDLRPNRVQGLFMSDKPGEEFYRVLDFIKEQAPEVTYSDEILVSSESGGEVGGDGDSGGLSDDPLFRQAAELVITSQKGSASFLQTKMKIGFARAARLIDELEGAGIVGPADGPRPREVMASSVEAVFGQQVEE